MSWHYGWRPYVSVAARRARAARKLEKLRRQGLELSPVQIQGRKIAKTFWGEAWCAHLEKFSDYENRLPRGRTYLRNGSVCRLEIGAGTVKAVVAGSELYNVKVKIKKLAKEKWREVKARCDGQIGSLLELLQGRISQKVMAIVTDRERGLFPLPREMELKCDCPDWAVMCKHVAAVLYAVGARLDRSPELLFLLRGVDQEELIGAGAEMAAAAAAEKKPGVRRIAESDLGQVFGIDLAEEKPAAPGPRPREKTAPPRLRRRAPLTGRAVARVRRKLNLSQAEFAKILGVSAGTVGNWERKKGRLKLQARTLRILDAVVNRFS